MVDDRGTLYKRGVNFWAADSQVASMRKIENQDAAKWCMHGSHAVLGRVQRSEAIDPRTEVATLKVWEAECLGKDRME
jgi:hypothetical protein